MIVLAPYYLVADQMIDGEVHSLEDMLNTFTIDKKQYIIVRLKKHPASVIIYRTLGIQLITQGPVTLTQDLQEAYIKTFELETSYLKHKLKSLFSLSLKAEFGAIQYDEE